MNGAWPGESIGTTSNNDVQKQSSQVEDKSSPVDPAEDQNLQSLHSSLKNELDQMQLSVKKRNHDHREQLEQFRTALNQKNPSTTSLDYNNNNAAMLSGRTYQNIANSQTIGYQKQPQTEDRREAVLEERKLASGLAEMNPLDERMESPNVKKHVGRN